MAFSVVAEVRLSLLGDSAIIIVTSPTPHSHGETCKFFRDDGLTIVGLGEAGSAFFVVKASEGAISLPFVDPLMEFSSHRHCHSFRLCAPR